MRRKLTVALLSTAICLLVVTSALAVTYNESPMLRTKVAAGELPPVEERLPNDPVVLNEEWNELPREALKMEVGQYGGVLRTVRPDPNSNLDIYIMNREPLLRSPGITTDRIRGNILKDYEASADNKVFTFYMREGLKWSDGMPVTTEDVLFAYEDFLLNENLTPWFPAWLRREGEPLKLEVIDEYTFRISFAGSYGNFLVQLAIGEWRGHTDLLKPKHYLKQFHPRYTPLEELEPLIEEQGLAEGEWWTLFFQKDALTPAGNPNAIGFPGLSPWLLVETTPELRIYERNPYYFKVDAAGNQLPYIDGIRDSLVSATAMIPMKVIAGEVDYLQAYGVLKDVPLYRENEQEGGYRTLITNWSGPLTVNFNNNHPDPVWQEVIGDVRFRKALSLAINREEIIDAVYLGFGEVPTTLPGIEYNPAKANQLLDEMGMDKRDAEGWRLGPDGDTFVLPFLQSDIFADWVPSSELVAEHFRTVGIKTTVKPTTFGAMYTVMQANELKATVMDNSVGLWRDNIYAIWPLPWAPLWGDWYETNGESGEEPPEEVKRLFTLFTDSYEVVPGSPESKKIWDEVYRLYRENYWFTLITEQASVPLIVPANSNFADATPPADLFGIGFSYAMEQMFFRQ